MACILALDTSGDFCSVALACDGEYHEISEWLPRGHAERMLPLVHQILADHGYVLSDCDAIAFGRGPGSFTGLRIAVGIAHGLSFGVGCPLVPVSTLHAIALNASEHFDVHDGDIIFAAKDARMGQIYYAGYELIDRSAMQLTECVAECVCQPNQVKIWHDESVSRWAAGDGFDGRDVFPELWGASLRKPPMAMRSIALPIAKIAEKLFQAGQAVSNEDAMPVYLRNDVTSPSRSV